MKEIKAIIQPFMLEKVLDALRSHAELPGVTVSEIKGFGKESDIESAQRQKESQGGYGCAEITKLEIVVSDKMAKSVVDLIVKTARTGKPGDGLIFVTDVQSAFRIQTGKRV